MLPPISPRTPRPQDPRARGPQIPALCPQATHLGPAHHWNTQRLWNAPPEVQHVLRSSTTQRLWNTQPEVQQGLSSRSPASSSNSSPAKSHCRDPPIDQVSSLASEANERLNSFTVALGSSSGTNFFPGGDGQHVNPRNWNQDKRPDVFGEILKQVDALRGEGPTEIVTLRKNTPCEDLVAKNCTKLYRLPLPTKPARISASLSRVYNPYMDNFSQEGTLSLYASIDNEKPSSRNHMYAAHEVLGNAATMEVEHVHAFLIPTPGDDGTLVDRRKFVPSHKYLYLAIEAQWAECQYKIVCSQRKETIILTQTELRERQTGQTMQPWQVRIYELKTDAVKSYEFQARVRKQREIKKKERESQKSIITLNRDIATPRSTHNEFCQRRVQVLERTEQVHERQETNSENLKDRREEWLQRAEHRKQRRMEEEERLRHEMEQYQRQQNWLMLLFLNMQSIIMGQEWQRKKKAIEEWYELNFAAAQVQSTWIRKYSMKRRQDCYMHIALLRAGLSVYVRQTRLFVFVRAGICIADLLENTLVGSSIDAANSIRHFLWIVRLIQRQWRRLKRIRGARLEIYMHWFRKMEPDVLRNIPLVTKRKIKRASEFHRECPERIVADVLMVLIVEQQRQWVEAMQAFKNDEANRFACATAGVIIEAPKINAFLLSKSDLEKLIVDTHDRWRGGEFDKKMMKLQEQAQQEPQEVSPKSDHVGSDVQGRRASQTVEEDADEPQSEKRKTLPAAGDAGSKVQQKMPGKTVKRKVTLASNNF